MPTRVENGGYGHDRWSAEAVCNIIGVTLLVLDVQRKFLQVCGPLLIVIVMKFPFCLYELQGLVVYVDEHFLPKNIMFPLSATLDD